jgi:hypothetical protein
MPVVVGESGAKDSGDNSVNNTDTTHYLPADLEWLSVVASYLRGLSDSVGHQPSWFFWAWNANSGEDSESGSWQLVAVLLDWRMLAAPFS